MTDAVRPAALEPLPDVYTEMGATCSTNLRNCDLAVEGSPSISTLMSPLMRVPSGSLFLDPPKSKHAIALLMSGEPKMDGAMLPKILSRQSL